MIVIRSDKDDAGGSKQGRSFLPLLGIIAAFIVTFLVIPLGIVFLFHLPWSLSSIYPYGILPGVILIVVGVWTIYKGIKELQLSYSIAGYDKGDNLVTTGIYAYTRNPMYFGAILMILGWFLVSTYIFILIAAVLFTILFTIVAKSEEKQLQERFGKKYLSYKRKVPLFFPYRRP